MNSRPFLKQLRCNHRAEQQNQQAQRHQSTHGNVVCCRKFLPGEPQQEATKQNFEGHGHMLLNNLESNWAYMVMASLAWSLKCWAGLMIRPTGTGKQREQQKDVRHHLLRMEFGTFKQALVQIPAQIVRTSRRLIYRLLSFRSSVEALVTVFEHASRPA